MAKGTDLFSLMTKCSEYFGQISALICDVDASLKESDFPVTGKYRKAVTFGQGALPDKPAKWGPRYFVRVYARPEWSDLRNHSFWGFFCIYLLPETFGEPVAAWGVVRPENPNGNKGPIIRALGMLPNPRFVERLERTKWCPAFANPLWKDVSYRACALADLTSADVIQKLVIQPFCKRLLELSGPPRKRGR